MTSDGGEERVVIIVAYLIGNSFAFGMWSMKVMDSGRGVFHRRRRCGWAWRDEVPEQALFDMLQQFQLAIPNRCSRRD